MKASSQITDMLTTSYRHVSSLDYDLPQALVGVWLSCGPDFQLEHDIETDEGADALVFWWFREGRHRYRGVRDVLDRHLFTIMHARYLPKLVSEARLVPTPLLSLLYSQRTELSGAFDLNTPTGVSLLWRWWLEAGQHEIMGETDWPTRVQIDSLRAAKVGSQGRLPSGQGLPNELIFVYALLPDVRDFFDIDTEADSSALLMWWLRSGALSLGAFGQDVNRTVMQNLHWDYLPKTIQAAKLSPTPLLAAAGAANADLQIAFDLRKKSAIPAIWRWWLDIGSKTYPCSAAGLKETILRVSGLPNAQFKLPFGQSLPNALVFIYALRADLHKIFDIRTETGASAFLMWWLTAGSLDFGESTATVNRALMLELHWRHLTKAIGGSKLSLTPLLALIREARPDLRQLFNTKTGEGRSALWRWWFAGGNMEYPGTLADIGDAHSELCASRPARLDQAEKSGSSIKDVLPNELLFIYDIRSDLHDIYDIKTEAGATAFTAWWLTIGAVELRELGKVVSHALMHDLHWSYLQGIEVNRLPLTPLLSIILKARPDLRRIFNTRSKRGVSELWRWWAEHGINEISGAVGPIVGSGKELSPIQPGKKSYANHALSEAAGLADCHVHFSLQEKSSTPVAMSQPAEVCLIGYSRGEFGLGEDARLLRAALEAKGIIPTVVRPSWHITARQEIDDISIDDTQAQFDSDVIFYVMPAFDTVTLLNHVGPKAFSARRKIGFWQWELDHFPPSAKLAMGLVDEIWCHSGHAAKAFRNATDKPVIKVPLPVFVPEPKKASRKSFGLPPNAFVVLTAYDGASSVARKNPLGSILAFRQAFADKGIDAWLVVKAMNTNNDSLWRECVRKAADQQIIIIDEVLDRQTYYQLLRNCDAVISLHRAEGFGRLMAEAMALGIPAIASRYSGNLEFMTDANSWLIDGSLIPVMPGDYPFHQDQHWLEPDIAQAANALRECATNPVIRKQRGDAGKRDITSRYSIEACGKVYLDLLKLPAKSSQTNVA